MLIESLNTAPMLSADVRFFGVENGHYIPLVFCLLDVNYLQTNEITAKTH